MATRIETDLEWKRQIIGLDAPDLSVCYQCGTCTAVCPVSTADNPFPRKEMVWVQWGLKERALGNASIWLCHQCGTCNTYCPRDAKPSNVMAALRNYSISHYAVPRFMGRALTDPRYLPLLFAIPAAIFLAILGWLGHLGRLPEGRIVFSRFLPIAAIEVTFVTCIALSLVGAVMGGMRYWRAMHAGASLNGERPPSKVVATLWQIMKHRRFAECTERPVGTRETHKRHLHHTHLAVFYGFLGLVVTTASVGIGIYAFGYLTPWPFWHPVKILGNASGTAVIVAVAVFLWRRIADARQAGKSTYSDWLFLTVLGLTTLTGFLSQWLRLAGWRAAYPMYFIHLLFVFFLLVYIPYSKFAHLVYRSIAMLQAAGSAGRAPAHGVGAPVVK
ncbi:MAG TPA: quinone-interacting membrane-bound oxidoreductase complex subunit QmoC [Methylomirabilota bacterium]|jgi:quinone-modifying oxidoreductase subunit QmoC|nr:quinone-interacting membrane-bound oxidoreductase complex subunit QmoC [Methylomirabilota bacterium]